ncbi:hypothetical protein MFLO_13830 [Listeria floridensis FSL S10-1187]|uniref:Uncharacterized protein n=1 Tax=Listeria floridensis FSL S10-1187 TaxID=1265817 RepID=A0ABN0RCK5_9LIST|nr:hypothetical protein [Listeria floridensis]EUJ26956.1 hypothetical protein MFLO_13830 [Listeria floridensis FSL S10-1187]
MKSPWIPIFYNKENNTPYFYHFQNYKVVEGSYSTQGSLVTILSGVVGVVLYSLLKSYLLTLSTVFLVFLSSASGLAISVILIFIVDKIISKNFQGHQVSLDQIPASFFEEGAKQFNKQLRIVFILLLLALICSCLLYLSNGELIVFFITTLSWILPAFVLAFPRPVKRRKMYTLYKRNQLPIENGE